MWKRKFLHSKKPTVNLAHLYELRLKKLTLVFITNIFEKIFLKNVTISKGSHGTVVLFDENLLQTHKYVSKKYPPWQVLWLKNYD